MSVVADHDHSLAEPVGGRFNDVLATLRIRIAGRLKLGILRRSTRYGLRRDLQAGLAKPKARIGIFVRPLVAEDLPHLLSLEGAGQAERLDVARRRAFVERYPDGCFVAVDARTLVPCYMQWLFRPADNELIGQMGGFPQLQADEALLENAYTPASYRGLGIMSEAMALIAERAEEFGARHVLTFVEDGNIASLKGCQRAGFFPHLLQHRTQIGFGIVSRDRIEILAENDPRRPQRF